MEGTQGIMGEWGVEGIISLLVQQCIKVQVLFQNDTLSL